MPNPLHFLSPIPSPHQIIPFTLALAFLTANVISHYILLYLFIFRVLLLFFYLIAYVLMASTLEQTIKLRQGCSSVAICRGGGPHAERKTCQDLAIRRLGLIPCFAESNQAEPECCPETPANTADIETVVYAFPQGWCLRPNHAILPTHL